MKKVRMIVSAVVVFAVVGSALAFTKGNPNLYFCNAQEVCVLAPYSDIAGPFIEPNPPALFKPVTNFDCSATGDCKPIHPGTIVFIND